MLSRFRNFIPSEHFPAEKGRYVLYYNACCPWAHRCTIVHGLKGLEDVVELIEADAKDPTHGWWFSGRRGLDRDPICNVRYLKELYRKADPHYDGRIIIPVLWDKRNATIVSNASSDIMRIFIDGFDHLLPPEKQEANKGRSALIPENLRVEIDALNTWVYDTVNNGVYKVGFAGSQAAYNQNVVKLFQSLDRLENHLSIPHHQPYLFGQYITEADIRLFTTVIRFDIVYYNIFKCNIRMIRTDYPRLHTWLKRLYWSEGPETAGGVFKKTTEFDVIKASYSTVCGGNGLVPAGPLPHIMPP
ncbi:transferase [Lojkania enalia]|uniref:Transferase n=1 Tax=Lojkania enalia TaxID=147567 RepID=A0A9P4K857_9PLEO|nr:transferase [Didymosphaeria enalia]